VGEFIGVMSPLQLSDAVEFDLDCLKQAALLFDRVAMPGLSIVLKNRLVTFPDDLLNELTDGSGADITRKRDCLYSKS
jgi:hypothetical protein